MYRHAPQHAGLRPRIRHGSMVKRGAVTITPDPPEFRWNDAHVPLSRVEAAMLAALLRRSRLCWSAVDLLLTENGCCADSRDVLIHRIRRKFASVGGADPITTVRGWGLRYRTEADAQGSSAFWIGVTQT